MSKSVRTSSLLYIGIFVLCWMFSLAAAILNNIAYFSSRITGNDLFPLYLAMGITAPSQGFFNAIVYGFDDCCVSGARRRRRRHGREAEALLSTTPTAGSPFVVAPLFRSSVQANDSSSHFRTHVPTPVHYGAGSSPGLATSSSFVAASGESSLGRMR